MKYREAFEKAGHPIPEDADYFFRISGTKFMVFSSYTGEGWMFGPGVGVMNKSWFLDSFYEVPIESWRPLDREISVSLPTVVLKALEQVND